MFEEDLKKYEFHPERAMDFIYDEHGNVIYGFGFSGAPRLPRKNMGMNVDDFAGNYIKVKKYIRKNFLLTLEKTDTTKEEKLIIIALKSYEDNNSMDELITKLNDIAVKHVDPRVYCYPQLKYFLQYHIMLSEYASIKEKLNHIRYSCILS
jgi:hypothetical protein